MPIDSVTDTAHWVAMYRASESDRADALFNDPYARLMAGDLGSTIVREIPNGESMAWAVIVRTAVLDEMVLDRIEQGATRVLNLGAGLDTRAFRLKLPPSLYWFDVDLPRMVAHRRACLQDLQPRCNHSHVVADVTDAKQLRHALDMSGVDQGPMLVVSEGLLIYLDSAQVSTLATALAGENGATWWLTDIVSPMLLGLVGNRWPTNEAAASAPFKFAPRDSAGFFETSGWREIIFRSTLDEALRLGRFPAMAQWWEAFVSPWWPGTRQNLRRMWGVTLMEAVTRASGEARAGRKAGVPA